VNTCFGIVHNQADAEDLAQEVFLEIFTSAGDLEEMQNYLPGFTALPLTISKPGAETENATVFFSRWKKPLPEEKTKQGNYRVYRRSTRRRNFPPTTNDILHHALDRLPEKQRIAFTLNKYEEMSYKQIAEVMKISLSSSRH
jgi:RNA polymerase sigma-70 factor (ECF subfamily)